MDRGSPSVLTPRQRDVLQLVRRGMTNREIAGELGITEDGVKAHLSRLFLRFGVTNRVELLAAADMDPRADQVLSATTALGGLRAIAGRARDTTASIAVGPGSNGLAEKLASVRAALAAVDGALGIVGDLPPDATGSVVTAVRKRLADALEALEDAQSGALHTA